MHKTGIQINDIALYYKTDTAIVHCNIMYALAMSVECWVLSMVGRLVGCTSIYPSIHFAADIAESIQAFIYSKQRVNELKRIMTDFWFNTHSILRRGFSHLLYICFFFLKCTMLRIKHKMRCKVININGGQLFPWKMPHS